MRMHITFMPCLYKKRGLKEYVILCRTFNFTIVVCEQLKLNNNILCEFKNAVLAVHKAMSFYDENCILISSILTYGEKRGRHETFTFVKIQH